MMMADKAKTYIHKTRHILKDGKFKWEIDTYDGIDLVIAEIEIPKVGTKFAIPRQIKKELIMDVTEFPQFTNKSLSEKL